MLRSAQTSGVTYWSRKIYRYFPALFLRTRDSPSGAHRTLFVDEFVPIIGALGLTVRADALDTFRGQFRLLLGNEIRQSLAYFGVREDPLAVLTG